MGQSQSPPQSITRDPQAISVLSQSIAAVGGLQAILAVQDLTATGNITYFWANQTVSGTVVIKELGLAHFRLDATLSDGVQSWIMANGTSVERRPDGSLSQLPVQLTYKTASFTFPFLQVLAALQDPSWDVSHAGSVTHNGRPAYDIRLQKTYPQTRDPLGLQSKASKSDIFIDSGSLLILAVQSRTYGRNGRPTNAPHELQYSNYQLVNGLQFPMTILDLIGGQQTSSIQVSQVAFNQGLSDSDFLP